MSLPADLNPGSNASEGKKDDEKKWSRNAKRRKPKKMHDLQDVVPENVKIDEIVSFLYSTITDGKSENSTSECQNNSIPTAGNKSVGEVSDSSFPVSGTEPESSSETGRSWPSTSMKHLVPEYTNMTRNEAEAYWNSCLSSCSMEETMMKIFQGCQKNQEGILQQRGVSSDKAYNVLNNSRTADLNESVEKSLMNNFRPGAVHSVSELEEQIFMSYKNQKNSSSDESEDELPDLGRLMVSEVNKNSFMPEEFPSSSGNRVNDSKDPEKVRRTKPACTNSGEFDGKQKVFLNSNLTGPNQRDGGGPNRERTPNKQQQQQLTPAKYEKKTPRKDMLFPKYLTNEEMDSISRFGVLLSGVIRINQKNFKQAYIAAPDKGMDILIKGLLDRNRALEGDEVYYVIKGQEHFRVSTDNGEVQRTAAVVALKNIHHNRTAIGTLKPPDKGMNMFAMFSPRDFRIPRIRIKKNNWPPGFKENPESFKDKLYHAKINRWKDVRYAEGEITKEVGIVGDIESETSAIMLMYELEEKPYPESLKRFFPKLPYVISNEEIAARLDLRGHCIFTIDPPTAKDLDDAVSCVKMDNGNYQIGVHISDVTHFLEDGSPLDAAVGKRATTVYLVQKVYHMLPRELCELCSLTPGEDKFAFSVMWEMTPDFKILRHYFAKTVINSCSQLSYDHAQAILDGLEMDGMPEIHGGHTLEKIKDTIITLNRIAVKLREKRFSNGALRIDQTKITFDLDVVGLPCSYSIYENKQAHRLIEEFMLLANITVAEEISTHFPDIAFLRSHSPPSMYMLGKIQKNLEKYGISLDISSSKSLQSSLIENSGPGSEPSAMMMVINTLLAKAMARANYYCGAYYPDISDRRHYALNVPLYTHFTSPIRRYADIMVHRLLAACLRYTDKPKYSPEDVQKIAENCNKQKYAAKLAGEKSTELFLNVFISLKGPLICEAVVCDIKDKSFDCIVLENGSHQRVYYESCKAKSSVKTENGVVQLTVSWSKSEAGEEMVQVIDLFSVVKVELIKAKEPNKIKARLLPDH